MWEEGREKEEVVSLDDAPFSPPSRACCIFEESELLEGKKGCLKVMILRKVSVKNLKKDARSSWP